MPLTPDAIEVENEMAPLNPKPTSGKLEEKKRVPVERRLLAEFIHAASEGDHDHVAVLLKKEPALLNCGDYDERTALHVAVSKGQLQMVKLLVDSFKADVMVKDGNGCSPLDEAVKFKRKEIAVFLRKKGAKHANSDLQVNDFINAVAKGQLAEVKELIQCGASVKCADYDLRTPLHLAVATRNLDMVKCLIEAGADARANDRFGNSPLEEALSFHLRTGNDPIKQYFQEEFKDILNVNDEHAEHHHTDWNTFVWTFGAIEIIFMVLFTILADYDFSAEANKVADPTNLDEDFTYLSDVYGWFMDIHVMIFIGFGFLMTFLRKYNFSAVGLTFLIGAYCIQLHILVEYALYPIFFDAHGLHITIVHLILGDFCAGAVLITYGVLLGKVNPMQLLTIATCEVFIFTLNELIGISMGITDVGGSMVVHMFGAFFGIAVSMAMHKLWMDEDTLSRNCSVYNSDTFAMIGTVFLWMFWPSFNVCLAADDEARHMGIVNTVLALCGSCVVAFLASNVFRLERKFDMVDIQNATLAGGVAMGTSADLNVNPGLAIIIGGLGGLVSVVGYTNVQGALEKHFKLHDTCGVNNLHGMPSLVGAFTGVIILAAQGNNTTSKQNLAFIFVTLAMSIVGGIVTGVLVSVLVTPVAGKDLFEDQEYWEVPGGETPYYFDKRGELNRDDEVESGGNRQLAQIALLKNRLDDFEGNLKFFRTQLDVVSQKNQGSSDISSLETMFRRVLRQRD